MTFLAFALLAVNLFLSIQASEIDLALIAPFPQTEETTKEYAAALKYKPQLYVCNDCYPHPAVDADGNTNAGLTASTWYWSPSCGSISGTRQGSQVYSRATKYNDIWTIMHTWYFPKDTERIPFYFGHRHRWKNAIVWLNKLFDNTTISMCDNFVSQHLPHIHAAGSQYDKR